MEMDLASKVRAAARAGWWTVILVSLIMTGAWFLAIAIVGAQPAWLGKIWPGEVDWDEIQALYVRFFAVFKMIVWTMIALTIWLTCWGARLRRLAERG